MELGSIGLAGLHVDTRERKSPCFNCWWAWFICSYFLWPEGETI